MNYFILIVIIGITGCNNIYFEDYKIIRERLKEGIKVTENTDLKYKGKYIYIQKINSNTKYGYDYKTKSVSIKFKKDL